MHRRKVRGAHLLLVLALAGFQAGCGASLNTEGLTALDPGAGSASAPADPTIAAGPTAETGGLASGAGLAATRSAVAPETTPPATGAIPSSDPMPGYTIGAQDVLEVSVFKVPELSKSVQVAETGTVNLPLVGEIKAAGRTAQDVERELTQKLGAKYLQSPQVTVSIKEYNSQRVTIDGAVRKPGVIPYRSAISLLQVIAMADGLDADSDSTVVVFRNSEGKRTAARFDISEIRSGSADDPQIKPGDIIVAGSSAVKAAFNNFLKALPVAGLFMAL